MPENLSNAIVAYRRNLHENPELGYREFNTARFIAERLTELQILFKQGVAGTKTGIIAELKKGDGLVVALRADIDALPMQEQTGLPFASKTSNMMHACGHDMHTAMLLGAAHILKDTSFNGTVKFVFQPSEEGAYDDAERKSGGQRIAESGELDGVNAMVGMHVHPLMPVGTIGYTLGTAFAYASFFRITVLGKASHAGAAPHLGNDAVVASAYLVQALHTIVARNLPPGDFGVISVTKINGGVAENVIADKVVLEGTVRALDTPTYEQVLKKRMLEIIAATEAMFHCRISIEFTVEYPNLVNDATLHGRLQPALQNVFSENVQEIPPLLAGEDFAFYSHKIPSMFYLLGAQVAGNKFFLHHPSVVFNEECMLYGAKFLAGAALEVLSV